MGYLNEHSYYIFGSGTTGKLFRSILIKNKKNVISFLSSEIKISQFDDIPVLNPGDAMVDVSVPVIIAVFNREQNAHMKFITEYLSSFKFNKIITVYEFFEYYSEQIENLYWLTSRSFYEKNSSKLLLVKKLFKEQKSISVFESIFSFLKSFDSDILPAPDFTDQYFPVNLDVWDGQDAFLDIGSFDGQTIIDAANKYGRISMAIAYEPDPKNIKKILYVLNTRQVADQVIIVPCGVWSKTEILRFSSVGGESSSIKEDGEITIQCLSLDETLVGVKPGYLKMDIEGSELEALKGAELYIKSFGPSLAISLYHNPTHLFEIPLLIDQWNLNYDYFIRSHGNNLFETLLYCIPKKKIV
jgi:FkbM family methyltransferase